MLSKSSSNPKARIFNATGMNKLLIDKNMNKTELRTATGITTTALAKLGRNENVNTEVLVKICKVLECDISDIMEITDIEEN